MAKIQQTKYIYLNGECVPYDEAKIHVLSVGFTYASTVFEGIRAYWNSDDKQLYVFRVDAHVRRLLQSMKLLRMKSDITEQKLRDSIIEIIKANELKEDAHIRQLVFIEGIGPIATSEPVGLTVAAMPSYRFFDTDKGVSCCISSWKRICDDSLPPRIKCTANYQNGRHAFLQAKFDGYEGAILLNERGKVAEGPTMCVFLVRDGKVITPSISSGVLESITRDTIIQLFREYHDIEVIEREVERTEFYIANEAFFCGTACEVLPIVSVDHYQIGDGKPGTITRSIQKTYTGIVTGESKDHSQWRLGVY